MLDLAARALQPTQERRGFFPGSGSSARAVIACSVYPVTIAGARGEAPVGQGSARPDGGNRAQASAAASAASVLSAAVSAVEVRGAGAVALTAPSERMSIRHPVSRAASRAFCPSLPIASESW